MKKLFISLLLLAVFSLPAYAQTSTPEPTETKTTPTPTGDSQDEIEKIKDLVASRVAELKLVEKRGILGHVTQSTSTQINIQDVNGNARIVEIDEITKFADPDSKTFGVSDIKSGNVLGIIGLLNKQTNKVLARFVDRVDTIPTYFEGVIIEVDKANFTYTAVNEKGEKTILNVETSTKIDSFNTEDGQVKAGFSKGTVGVRVWAAGYPDSKVKNQLNATRILILTDVPLSEKMKGFAETMEEVTPTVKTTPTEAP